MSPHSVNYHWVSVLGGWRHTGSGWVLGGWAVPPAHPPSIWKTPVTLSIRNQRSLFVTYVRVGLYFGCERLKYTGVVRWNCWDSDCWINRPDFWLSRCMFSRLVHWSCGSLVHWSTGPLVLWSNGSLIYWSICPVVHCFIGPLVHWSTGPLIRWSTSPLIRWSTGPLVYWSTGPVVHWFFTPLIHWSCGPLIHWSIVPQNHRFTGPLVHWSTGPLVHWSTCLPQH